MHEPARLFVSRWATTEPCRVYEVGSREPTGAIRALFPAADYLGVDVRQGPNVDQVEDGAIWVPGLGQFDYAISTEVFEHAQHWRQMLLMMIGCLRPGGRVIVTCAGPNRRPHSASDGGPWLEPDEWYCPVFPKDLAARLRTELVYDSEVESNGDDVFATAVRR